jgi:SAM-dependent methyltransferase
VSGPLDADAVAHYGLGGESGRLAGGRGRLELVRTQEILARVLPPPPAVVLDVGGASGAHALPLAARGYAVHLLDPVALHVEQARTVSDARPDARVASAEAGDARDLPWPDESADAVLLLGPLYHLTEATERARALEEARRVLRRGGVLVAAAISRFASTHDGLRSGMLVERGFEAMVERDVAEGRHSNPGRDPAWFTTAYFHRPEELRDEVEAAGLAVEALLAVEGAAGVVGDVDAWLDDPERRELLLRALRRVEAEPGLLGASDHVLAVAHA